VFARQIPLKSQIKAGYVEVMNYLTASCFVHALRLNYHQLFIGWLRSLRLNFSPTMTKNVTQIGYYGYNHNIGVKDMNIDKNVEQNEKVILSLKGNLEKEGLTKEIRDDV